MLSGDEGMFLGAAGIVKCREGENQFGSDLEVVRRLLEENVMGFIGQSYLGRRWSSLGGGPHLEGTSMARWSSLGGNKYGGMKYAVVLTWREQVWGHEIRGGPHLEGTSMA